MALFGVLLRLRRVKPSRVWGYSAPGAFLMGIGLGQGAFELAIVFRWVGAVAFLVGLILTGVAGPRREADITKLDL